MFRHKTKTRATGLFELGVIIPQMTAGTLHQRYIDKGYGQTSGKMCRCCGRDLYRFPIYFTDVCLRCNENGKGQGRIP